jgi:hypothetical protein
MLEIYPERYVKQMLVVVHSDHHQMTDTVTEKSEFQLVLCHGTDSHQNSMWKPGFNPSPVHVKFVVKKLELEKVFLQVL